MDGPAGEVGGQRLLDPKRFPMPVKWCAPLNLGTADCAQLCMGIDNCNYVIKDGRTNGSHPLVPHAEWFCSELAELIHIASPPHKIIEMSDGSLAFGSRWEGGVKSPENNICWWNCGASREDFAYTLSRIYAFDLFVANVDRHANNFIFRDQRTGEALIANDYSRAWVTQGFPLPQIPLPACNTVQMQRWLRQVWKSPYIQPETVSATLSRIVSVERRSIERIIGEHPQEWLHEDLGCAIVKWWSSEAMLARIKAISDGVKDGSCL